MLSNTLIKKEPSTCDLFRFEWNPENKSESSSSLSSKSVATIVVFPNQMTLESGGSDIWVYGSTELDAQHRLFRRHDADKRRAEKSLYKK
uniref:Uncharacterized protein n=1 Tax=Romanomermis culicivorax TaxID=13658 RepID=A0A915L779_ROMCU